MNPLTVVVVGTRLASAYDAPADQRYFSVDLVETAQADPNIPRNAFSLTVRDAASLAIGETFELTFGLPTKATQSKKSTA